MIYDIKLRIAYQYANPAVGGRHVICVMPLEMPGQRLMAGLVDITPRPEERLDRVDFFGNRITEFSYRGGHDAVAFTLKARIERLVDAIMPAHATLLTAMPAALAACRDLGPASPLHFLSPSTRVPRDRTMTAFALGALHPDMTVAEAVVAVGSALYRHMRFDAKATTVDTPATEAFAKRQGVCQDFSHIMIACLRGIGLPAGYVSGFLRTLPPPGKPRLEGADAMHAWVRAWCGPDAGWIEFDPTNNKLASEDHIVVAYGRDYSDVSPIKGTMRISGGQKSEQAVDVIPLAS
ncbi:transglutaminase [Cypionkella aquatica]|uniref:Transglutaminase n=1 Tax=Cypionkella aquatica TaxID=1756042 RepID=A0AA37TUH8_9RHOB|nr:transglutaminase family protein [Cypionkella aquatica]GLS86025.1 transglutaminase [Cypionkella aquatica]